MNGFTFKYLCPSWSVYFGSILPQRSSCCNCVLLSGLVWFLKVQGERNDSSVLASVQTSWVLSLRFLCAIYSAGVFPRSPSSGGHYSRNPRSDVTQFSHRTPFLKQVFELKVDLNRTSARHPKNHWWTVRPSVSVCFFSGSDGFCLPLNPPPPPFVSLPRTLSLPLFPFCCLNLSVSPSPRRRNRYPWHQIPVDAENPKQCCASIYVVSFSPSAEPCSCGAPSQREFPSETMGSLPG